MIVGVLSDTHLHQPNAMLASAYQRHLRDTDVLLHCGDMIGEATWDYFNSHAYFYAVQGNCDAPALRGALPALRELELKGFRLGLAHGWGPRSQVGKTVADHFPGLDVVCYGHTHVRDWQCLPSGTWLLNPGSLFLPRSGPGGAALLFLHPGKPPTVQWIDLD